MNLKENGKVFTSKSAGTGPSSYKKRIYRAAVSQRLRNTGLEGPKNVGRASQNNKYIWLHVQFLKHGSTAPIAPGRPRL